MPKKYDTNPLDGEVLRRAEANREATFDNRQTQKAQSAPTAFFEAGTRRFQPLETAEMPVDSFNDGNLAEPYHSVFEKHAAANGSVSTAVKHHIEKPTTRKVIGLGVPENLAMILPYLPLTLGAIAAVIELLLTARTETRVRFHAAQALALHIAWLLINVILLFAAGISDLFAISGRFFSIAMVIFFFISMLRVWIGKAHHIEALDDLTDFLNEKLKPRK